LAGIPRVLAHCRENPYHLVSDWVRESEPPCVRHEVQRQLDLVSTIGATNPDPVLRFALRDADRISLFQKLAAYHLTRGTPGVVVHCGASAASHGCCSSSATAVASEWGAHQVSSSQKAT